ncbi:MAG TPA: hypothetical protein VGZ90_13480 [Puia sp.]|nr:hypothetical protein [Puia sp.]
MKRIILAVCLFFLLSSETCNDQSASKSGSGTTTNGSHPHSNTRVPFTAKWALLVVGSGAAIYWMIKRESRRVSNI